MIKRVLNCFQINLRVISLPPAENFSVIQTTRLPQNPVSNVCYTYIYRGLPTSRTDITEHSVCFESDYMFKKMQMQELEFTAVN